MGLGRAEAEGGLLGLAASSGLGRVKRRGRCRRGGGWGGDAGLVDVGYMGIYGESRGGRRGGMGIGGN